MKRLMMVMVSSFGVIAAAHAQVQASLGPDNGFFRPATDVALTSAKANAPSASVQQAAPYLTLQSGQPASVPPAAIPVPALVTPVANAPAVPNPAAQQPPQQAAQAAQPTVLSGPALTQATQAWAERQMDRSVSEADRDQARAQAAPAGVGAAFDGTTSNENR